MKALLDQNLKWLSGDPVERRNVAWFTASVVLTGAGGVRLA